MRLEFTAHAQEEYKKLPEDIKKKANKKLHLLLENYRYPSLRSRKMAGLNRFEARVDLHNRFTYTVQQDSIFILTIGMHDRGLGKK